jgi:hypothetical protein
MDRRWKKIFVLTKEEANGAEEVRYIFIDCLGTVRNGGSGRAAEWVGLDLLIPWSPVDHVCWSLGDHDLSNHILRARF